MKRTNSISIIGAALVMLVGLTVWAASTPESETNVASRANLHSYSLPSFGLALVGYCPVAYFAVNKPVRVKPHYPST